MPKILVIGSINMDMVARIDHIPLQGESVIGEGYSKAGPIPPTGNTNTRGFFAPTTREFMKKWVMEGPTHHFALGVGHHADEIAKIAEILGVPAVIVR